MRALLFLTQRIPYPPNKGDKIRSFAVLRHLSRRWRIHLGCFIDDPEDWAHVQALGEFCAEVHCVGLDKRRATLRSGLGLLTGRSLSEGYFRDRAMARWVRAVLENERPEAAYLFSSVMAQYVPGQGSLRPRRVVMDFVDVDSDKWRQYAKAQRWPMDLIYGREARRLLEFDRAVAARTDASLFVSPAEAALFRRLAPEVAEKVHGISNGIDFAYFRPSAECGSPYLAGDRAVVFTGAMDYRPNIDAVTWFAQAMLPAILAEEPQARFVVVGSNPPPEVERLAEHPRITVTGRVADVRPYLNHAAVAVAPMRLARGIQNKVLEGMAMARPVVTTPQGLEGIDALPGRDLIVAEDVPGFVQGVLWALSDPTAAALGGAARRRIVEGYGWEDKLDQVEALLEG